ncbi:unnamed protein product [Sphacelaria rigidula]
MDRVVDDLKQTTREINHEMKRFFSDTEWVSIDRALVETGTYAEAFISRAVGGDTGLHLSITLGSLHAAQVFVEEGCDPAVTNDEGISAVDLLSQNFKKVMDLLARILQLEEDDKLQGVRSCTLTAEKKACLMQKGRVIGKVNEYRSFAHGILCYFVKRMATVPALEAEARVCEIEGREINPAVAQELRRSGNMARCEEEFENSKQTGTGTYARRYEIRSTRLCPSWTQFNLSQQPTDAPASYRV